MLGLGVLMPMTEHGRYDLALEIRKRIYRVQCKWASRRGDVVRVCLMTSRHTPLNGYKRTKYAATEVDAVAAYCGDLDQCYFFPIGSIEGRTAIDLRLAPARNGQQAAINFAADYEFAGAVAQLEERRHGMAKAEGSSPSSSMNTTPQSIVVGAEKFRTHSPRYVQRAAAGEEFVITRRGKRMARLVPADPVPPVVPSPPSPAPADRPG